MNSLMNDEGSNFSSLFQGYETTIYAAYGRVYLHFYDNIKSCDLSRTSELDLPGLYDSFLNLMSSVI